MRAAPGRGAVRRVMGRLGAKPAFRTDCLPHGAVVAPRRTAPRSGPVPAPASLPRLYVVAWPRLYQLSGPGRARGRGYETKTRRGREIERAAVVAVRLRARPFTAPHPAAALIACHQQSHRLLLSQQLSACPQPAVTRQTTRLQITRNFLRAIPPVRRLRRPDHAKRCLVRLTTQSSHG